MLYLSYQYFVILHQEVEFTKKCYDPQLALLHSRTCVILDVPLLSVRKWSVWLNVSPSEETHVVLWVALCGKQVKPVTVFLVIVKLILTAAWVKAVHLRNFMVGLLFAHFSLDISNNSFNIVAWSSIICIFWVLIELLFNWFFNGSVCIDNCEIKMLVATWEEHNLPSVGSNFLILQNVLLSTTNVTPASPDLHAFPVLRKAPLLCSASCHVCFLMHTKLTAGTDLSVIKWKAVHSWLWLVFLCFSSVCFQLGLPAISLYTFLVFLPYAFPI